jgi:hypothetical protein
MWTSKKTVFTLNLNGYAPEITDLTYPLMEAYAHKIGADFHIIGERKFPEWPVTFEKLQIYDLAKEMNNDWNIYLDSDTLVHPDTPDMTLLLSRDTVAHFGKDFAPMRWRSDRYFERDGRRIGSGNWLAVASKLCTDLWKPPDDLTPQEAIGNCFPTVPERLSAIIHPSHLVDDYLLSRNIAKFGLKFKLMREIFEEAGFKDGGGFFYHHYLFNTAAKVAELKKVLRTWNLVELMGYDFPETPVDKAEKIKGWMARPELEWLYEKSKTMESVAAIGNFLGRSTFVLCSGCSGQVYAIDPFVFSGDWAKFVSPHTGYQAGDDFSGDFLKNVGHFSNLIVIKKTSVEAADTNLVPLKVDMGFFDGDHSYEGLLADLKAWVPRTRKLICGHDLDDPLYPGVRQALMAYFGLDRIVKGPGSLWYIRN